MLPKQKDIEIPLLEVLVDIGGQGKPKDIYSLVTKRFASIEVEDLAQTLPSGANRWNNSIQWVRQALVQNGDMSSPGRGIWAITDKGRKRLKEKKRVSPAPSADFLELYEEYEDRFRAKLLDKLYELSPTQFELFARKLLKAYGFTQVDVTGHHRDGGIDGHGKLVQGLVKISVAFQCKRWTEKVGRPVVDEFRGAVQGEYDQGILFTTSDFTSEAREASLKKGAAPVILVNWKRIVDIMIEKEIGVERTLLYMYYDRDLITDSLEEE